MKRVLITGANSYIGMSFEKWMAEKHSKEFSIDTIDMVDDSWRQKDFSLYDAIFHVAGIAHADIGHISKEKKALYYKVNCDLAIETAEKAKNAGVRQFVFMSSIIIYGDSAPLGKRKVIRKDTKPHPTNFYGDSKWQADKRIRKLDDTNFNVAVLRPPMIYGKGSKGNYPVLSKLAKSLPVFPRIENERSMLYIDNLCEFLYLLIKSGNRGVYFPQNAEYVKTYEMVKEIAKCSGHKMCILKICNPLVWFAGKIPGKISGMVNKAFGNLVYEKSMSNCFDGMYQKKSMEKSIEIIEIKDISVPTYKEKKLDNLIGKRILFIALSNYADGIIAKMKELGAEVDYINDKPNDGIFCKFLGRLKIRSYQKIIAKYYYKKLQNLRHNSYDFILVIRGEYTPVDTLKLLKIYYPNSKLILYMWDGLNKLNTRGIEKKWPLYDRVYTFDRIDYETHKSEISFLPLYYYEDYLPKDIKNSNGCNFKYDLSFIGTGHGDRIRIVKEVMDQCRKKDYHCFSYFFIPHLAIYVGNKLFNKNFRNVQKSDVKYEMMPFEELYKVYEDSRCVIDVESSKQHGLTMRSIEIVGLRRKLITTNKDIINYDFYNSNNILVIDRKKCQVDTNFFEKPYELLDEEIYKKYALKNWILEVLK